jgi:hypothetical protein
MITFNIYGLDEVQDMIARIDTDVLCYKVANDLKAEVKKRVHVDGKASDGTGIGKYTPSYMKVRTGNYAGTEYKRGKKAGEYREEKIAGQAGVFSKGKNKGKPRPVYNRDTKDDVILSLTRQMELDLDGTEPIKIEGGYGIGYRNEHNHNKAVWNEKRYKKPIWKLTADEEELAETVVNDYIESLK